MFIWENHRVETSRFFVERDQVLMGCSLPGFRALGLRIEVLLLGMQDCQTSSQGWGQSENGKVGKEKGGDLGLPGFTDLGTPS